MDCDDDDHDTDESDERDYFEDIVGWLVMPSSHLQCEADVGHGSIQQSEQIFQRFPDDQPPVNEPTTQGEKAKLSHDRYDSLRSFLPQPTPLFCDDLSLRRREPSDKMPQYTSRDVGDPSQIKKTRQSMADLKLRRLTELNNRLREDLDRERIPVSTASKSIIAYCNGTRDYMVPSTWGAVPKGEDPYAPQQSGGCCLVM